ncbi:MAG: DUF3848 domain-containing protein [Lachnospiraceae bacterium]|nr:DUF3848 domain-containing protein [Lachnospiraceae bacterium]
MNSEEIQALFCCKLYRECVQFKEEQLKSSKEEIFGSAYKIDTVINIYEMLIEMSQKLEAEVMKDLLFYPDLLACFYEYWLKVEDSQYAELSDFLKRTIREVIRQKEVKAA